jgi:hypothetical protein
VPVRSSPPVLDVSPLRIERGSSVIFRDVSRRVERGRWHAAFAPRRRHLF